ncbi:hypothetical protein D3C78_1208350 [compost metagenome]
MFSFSKSEELFSSSSSVISSRSIALSSEVPKYLSRATRSSIRSIIFSVVDTPTSEVTKISSSSSSTSSSTVDLPAIILVSFEKTFSLVFSNPLSSASCSAFTSSSGLERLKKSNNPIICKFQWLVSVFIEISAKIG